MPRSITTIPATVSRYTASPLDSGRKRKVAAYARVSTDHEEQQTSYEAQVKYYTNYIQSRSDWEFVKVYSDEGISGTATKRRDGFNSMIADALEGKIDLILTKSVSRFARNTVDSLTAIRKLKEHGTECYFEKENIWTFDGKGELLLTIMASLAQEESRSLSENITWGVRKRFADGKVFVPYSTFLGYDRGPEGGLVVNPEQAKIIRRIYGKILLGMSAYQIAKELTEAGFTTPMGGKRWHPSTVERILKNEKYKGDALLQKTYTVDYLGKKMMKNDGKIPQYYVQNNHEAIISRDTFDLVQRLWEQRKPGFNRITYYSVFSCKIVCGDCGSWYGRNTQHPNTKYASAFWRCIHKYYDKKCTTPSLRETEIQARFLKAANQMITDRDRIISAFREALAPTLSTRALEKERAALEQELSSTAERIEAFLRENARRGVVQEQYQQDYAALTTHFEETKARIQELTDTITEYKGRKLVIRNYLRELRKKELLTEFHDRDWQTMVDHMTVYSKDDIRITFKDGTEIKT